MTFEAVKRFKARAALPLRLARRGAETAYLAGIERAATGTFSGISAA